MTQYAPVRHSKRFFADWSTLLTFGYVFLIVYLRFLFCHSRKIDRFKVDFILMDIIIDGFSTYCSHTNKLIRIMKEKMVNRIINGRKRVGFDLIYNQIDKIFRFIKFRNIRNLT